MESTGAPQDVIDALAPKVLTADGPGAPTEIGDYDFERRLTIEGEITDKAVAYIEGQKKSKSAIHLGPANAAIMKEMTYNVISRVTETWETCRRRTPNFEDEVGALMLKK